MQVRQEWRLKLILQIEVLGEQTTGRPCLQLTLAGTALSKEEKLAFELLGPHAAALDFLGTLIVFFRYGRIGHCCLHACLHLYRKADRLLMPGRTLQGQTGSAWES